MTMHESQIYLALDAFDVATTQVPARHDPAHVLVLLYYLDTSVFCDAVARYVDFIIEMDHWAGQFLDELERDGLAGNTIVVFWSDHGRGMPRAKRWPNEAGLREPLIVRWPGRIAFGTVMSDSVHTMDLVSTMLAAAGLTVPLHLHGTLLFDFFGILVDQPNEYMYGVRDRMDEVEDIFCTVRDARYCYICHYYLDRFAMQHTQYPDHLAIWAELRYFYFEEAKQFAIGRTPNLLTAFQRSLVAVFCLMEELYDILTDPHETMNLVVFLAYAGRLDRMRGALADWQQRYGDLGLLPEGEIFERWRFGGCAPVIATPSITAILAGLIAFCPIFGSSIAWTVDLFCELRDCILFEEVVGILVDDGRRWYFYIGVVVIDVEEIWF